MAQIRDELILVDRFSDPLRDYATRLGAAAQKTSKSYASINQAQAAVTGRMAQYQSMLKQTDNAYYRLSIQAEAQARQLTAMKRAGDEGSDAFKRLSASMDSASQREQFLCYQHDILTRKIESLSKNAGTASTSVQDAAKSTKQYHNVANQAASSTSRLAGMVRNLAGAFLGLRGVKAMGNLSDSMVQTRARLDILTGGEGTDQLQRMIYESAQRSRGDYMGTADMVSKMGIMAGDAFHNDPRELVAFTETLNKMYTVSGTNQAGQQAATLQLEQAMAMGVLRGQEFRSVVQQVPMLVQAVADSLGVSTGEVKKMADEGLITASVVKNAMFDAAEGVNDKFETMPMTWGQVWTSMKNTALMAAQPLLDGINFLANNIEIIVPLVLGIGTAFAVFMVAANWTNILTAATNVLKGAQMAFNAVMAANPIVWVVIAVAALIGLLYAGVAAFNKLTGASLSATGIIAGAVFAAGAAVANVFYGLVELVGGVIEFFYNGFAEFANFFANVFHDPVGSIIRLFGGLADAVLGVIETIASALDFVFGSQLADTVSGWRSSLASMTEAAANKYGNGSYNKLVEHLNVNAVLSDMGLAMERFNYGEAYQAGYNWGANFDPLGDLMNFGEGFDFSGMAEDVGAIAGDTKKLTANMADEDLKYMEDVAIRRYETHVNSTSLVPQITVQVNGSADRDTAEDIAGRIAAILRREASAQTSVSYAEV